MSKSLFIAEKPSVAMEFSKALKENMTRHDGYQESDNIIVTWCVGHLVTMSYPEVYDEKYKKWNLATLPFIPDEFRYEVIPDVKKQFGIVKGLLTREDVSTIYVCTDSGREGEYIYRLVAQMAGVKDKQQKRVWIDSQTEEEILRGIKEAKDESEYDHLSDAAYLRAKEDYLMGINFSRALTLKYGNSIANYFGERYAVISVGRVMTCVLGMIVRREREIRAFVETPFYRVIGAFEWEDAPIEGEWRTSPGSAYENSPKLYKENGFKKREDAQALIDTLSPNQEGTVVSIEKKKERKNPPLLYNLAELQNDCSRMFKISPDQTLGIVQELYEKKLVTYPRTDARVLSTAVAKEIGKNISGLTNLQPVQEFAQEVLAGEAYKKIGKSRYTDDSKITDHYAIIPTGQGLGALRSLKGHAYGVYLAIVRRFLSIFYPAAVYEKIALTTQIDRERFFSSFRVLTDQGYLKVAESAKKSAAAEGAEVPRQPAVDKDSAAGASEEGEGNISSDPKLMEKLSNLKKGMKVNIKSFSIKEGKTSPPKRYNSGTMILAMENAGQLIEDDDLREQIKGSGIGTSATRAEILKKLVKNRYIALNSKTQILTPTLRGEMIADVVSASIRPLLDPSLTASWEKGLTYVSDGNITADEYMEKLSSFIARRTDAVKNVNNASGMRVYYDRAAQYYKNDYQQGKMNWRSGKTAKAAGKGEKS